MKGARDKRAKVDGGKSAETPKPKKEDVKK